MMGTVRIVLSKELLEAADRAARRQRVNRSSLVRQALREYLQNLAERDREDRDRAGYAAQPVEPGEFDIWERAAKRT